MIFLFSCEVYLLLTFNLVNLLPWLLIMHLEAFQRDQRMSQKEYGFLFVLRERGVDWRNERRIVMLCRRHGMVSLQDQQKRRSW